MDILSFTEIPNWNTFEDLVADYFRQAKQDNEFNIDNVEVRQTGAGSDGGRDILVTFTVDDSIMPFTRKWIIQCKFYSRNVSKSHLSDINIPSLLHEYGADGYLLICKTHCTAPVSRMFEGFNSECPFKRRYNIWSGQFLLNKVRVKETIVKNYFPKHSAYIIEKKRKSEQLLNNLDI